MGNLLDVNTIVGTQQLALPASGTFLRVGNNRLVIVIRRKDRDRTEGDTDAACLADFSVYRYPKILLGLRILSSTSDGRIRSYRSVVTLVWHPEEWGLFPLVIWRRNGFQAAKTSYVRTLLSSSVAWFE